MPSAKSRQFCPGGVELNITYLKLNSTYIAAKSKCCYKMKLCRLMESKHQFKVLFSSEQTTMKSMKLIILVGLRQTEMKGHIHRQYLGLVTRYGKSLQDHCVSQWNSTVSILSIEPNNRYFAMDIFIVFNLAPGRF